MSTELHSYRDILRPSVKKDVHPADRITFDHLRLPGKSLKKRAKSSLRGSHGEAMSLQLEVFVPFST
jgi:hypothetical protein